MAKESAQNMIAPLQLLPTIPVPTLPTLSSAKKPALTSSGAIFNTTIDPKLLPQLSSSNNAIRGYSELKKSEAALQLELTKKETERDSAVRQAAELERRLKSEVSIRDAKIMTLESQLNIDNQQWQGKIQRYVARTLIADFHVSEKLSFLETSSKEQLSNAITLHASRYDELSSEHSSLRMRSKELEDNLERCGVDPGKYLHLFEACLILLVVSLTPFDTSIGLKEREERQREIKEKKAVLSEQIKARKEELKKQIESMKQLREQLESIKIEDIPVLDVASFTMDFSDKSVAQETLNKENVVNNVQVAV